LQTSEQISTLSRLCQIGQELASSTDTDELLAKISRCSSEVCNSETASIILLDENTDEMYFKKTSGDMGEFIKRIRIPLDEHSIAGWCIINKKPQIVQDVSKDPRHYKKVDQATKFITHSILAAPIIWGNKVFGVVEAVNKKGGEKFTEKDLEYLTVLAHQAAVALKNVSLMEKLQNFFSFSVEIVIAALEALEPFARGHIIRVARLAVSLARELNYEGKDLENIWYAAYFHDVGKLARESIYMSQQEVKGMYPTMGASLIENIKILADAAPIIRDHQERWDGSGYPDGKKGDEIPEGAQIIGIAKEFDEMWSVARDTQTRDEFDKKFIEHIQNKFKPEIIEKFSNVIKKIVI